MLRSACLLAVALLSGVLATAQSTIQVPSERPTIQAAIYAANDGDTILVAPGTYHELIDYVGKAITIVSTGGPVATIIDTNGMNYWNDIPYAAAVRFVNGEGRGSVLNGFTVTGHIQGGYSAPIWCMDLSPTILNCIVRDNDGGAVGGIYGDAWIEGCTIENNTSNPGYGPGGGGVAGTPTVVSCVIADNISWAGEGGGILALGPCDIIDCVITGNYANDFGRRGGGVYGPARLLGCVITDNLAEYNSGSTMNVGAGVDGALSVTNCTVVGNRLMNYPMTNDGGGITNSGDVVSSIVWGNDDNEIGTGMTGVVEYSCIEGGYAGTGNISSDPMFTDAVSFDFSLQLGSPCIDTGDPGTLDPDDTRVDMGALFFPQYLAFATLRYGTAGGTVNSYGHVANPVIGADWTAQVNANGHSGAPTVTVIVGFAGGSSPIPTPMGDILVDPTSALIFTTIAVPDGAGIGHHSLAIPLEYGLIGGTVYTQAAAIESGAIELANGWDLHLGL